MSQAGPSQIRDRRHKAASTTGKRVDEAILKLAERMASNTSVQDRLASAVQEGSNEHLAFWQWKGLEACKLSEQLWTAFMQESFQMIIRFRQLQEQQPLPPPPPPQPAQHPVVQQPQQSAFVCPSSAPPVVTPPPFCQQQPQQQPQQEILDLQPPLNWPSFSGYNISGLNTSGLSNILDHAVGQAGVPPAQGTSSQMNRKVADRVVDHQLKGPAPR